MVDVAVTGCWLMAGIGLVMVIAAAIARTTKRLLRLSDETVGDPWFRKHDTSGLSWAIHWVKPGLILMLSAGVVALMLETLA